MVLVVVVVFWLGSTIGLKIVRSVRQTAEAIRKIEQSGDFSVRVTVHGSDEIGGMATALNALLQQLQRSVDESSRVVEEVARGNFQYRVESGLRGDLETLKSGINGSADSVERTC